VNLTRLKLSPDQRRRGGVNAHRIWSFLFRSRLVWPSICLQRWVPTTLLTTTQTPYKVLFEYRTYTHYLFAAALASNSLFLRDGELKPRLSRNFLDLDSATNSPTTLQKHNLNQILTHLYLCQRRCTCLEVTSLGNDEAANSLSTFVVPSRFSLKLLIYLSTDIDSGTRSPTASSTPQL